MLRNRTGYVFLAIYSAFLINPHFIPIAIAVTVAIYVSITVKITIISAASKSYCIRIICIVSIAYSTTVLVMWLVHMMSPPPTFPPSTAADEFSDAIISPPTNNFDRGLEIWQWQGGRIFCSYYSPSIRTRMKTRTNKWVQGRGRQWYNPPPLILITSPTPFLILLILSSTPYPLKVSVFSHIFCPLKSHSFYPTLCT